MINEIRHDPDGGFTVMPTTEGVDAQDKVLDARAVLALALEALEGSIALTMPKIDLRKEAIAALREALAQPQQEPVAEVSEVWLDNTKATVIVIHGRYLTRGDKLYVSPPARKPLTRAQVKEIMKEAGYDVVPMQHRADFINGLRCGEAAHGIKE